MRLVATDLHATYSVREAFRMPYHSGGMLHGLFGRALRKVACVAGSCREGSCAGGDGCHWVRLFSPSASERASHWLLAGTREPPGPVVLLVPPPGRAELTAGDTVSVGLRLFGDSSAADVALLEATLGEMAALPIGRDHGRMELRAITRYSPREVLPLAVPNPTSEATPRPAGTPAALAGRGRMLVRFQTPLRLKRAGRVASELDFVTLFTHVWRRLTMLGALYGQYTAADDVAFRRLRGLAAGVRRAETQLTMLEWEHLSAETNQRKPMCGLMGHVVFEGESLGELWSVLAAGEAVHVGGATSFGLGRIEVEAAASAMEPAIEERCRGRARRKQRAPRVIA